MITEAEYGQRVARLKVRIEADGLDAFIVSEPENTRFASTSGQRLPAEQYRWIKDPAHLAPRQGDP